MEKKLTPFEIKTIIDECVEGGNLHNKCTAILGVSCLSYCAGCGLPHNCYGIRGCGCTAFVQPKEPVDEVLI
jgi:hypothetical protein